MIFINVEDKRSLFIGDKYIVNIFDCWKSNSVSLFVMEVVLDGVFSFLIILEVVVVDVKSFINYFCWIVLFFFEGDFEVFFEFDIVFKDVLYVDYIRKFVFDV